MHLFWTNALFMLPNCNKLEVSYGVGDAADFRPICQALVGVAGACQPAMGKPAGPSPGNWA